MKGQTKNMQHDYMTSQTRMVSIPKSVCFKPLEKQNDKAEKPLDVHGQRHGKQGHTKQSE